MAPETVKGPRIPTIVDWIFAPKWLTPAQAANLMGPHYTEASILALVEIGAVDTKEDEAILIEKDSLMEYRDALAYVLQEEAAAH